MLIFFYLLVIIIFIMEHISYLLEYNKNNIKLPHLQGKTLNYRSNIKKISFNELKRLLSFFNTAELKYGNAKIEYIITYTNEVYFEDKLTIVLFECLLYDLKINKGKAIHVNIRARETITTEELLYSCLFYNNKDEFLNVFKLDYKNTHFRKVVSLQDNNKNLNYLSIIMGDITNYLQNCNINPDYSKKASEIAIELLDNALDHSVSDCLIDIDVTTEPYKKNSDSSQEYQAVNIVVVNFSEKLLGEDIKKILDNYNESCGKQFMKLKEYQELHKNYFKNNYSSREFFMLSAFQNKITGRSEKALTGGKGLTKLIKGIQEYADTYKCYVVSGTSVIFFVRDYIKQDKDDWVGFNAENSFKVAPSYDVIYKSPIDIEGTAYNLNFVFKKEN